jgi:PAS domain S-box-containing protein
MNDVPFLLLAQNAMLLLGAAFLFDMVTHRFRLRQSLLMQAFAGFALGALGITVMLTSWVFGPGIVFDTRSILLGISGLFFGAFPTVIAMAMTAAFRIFQGGTGLLTGVLVILSSGLIGIAWRRFRRRRVGEISWGELYLFGVVVHAAMLGWMLMLPWTTALRVLSSIALPVILIYPAVTALLGVWMTSRCRREQAQEALKESEERYRSLFDHNIDAVLLSSPDGRIFKANAEACRIFGRAEEAICLAGRDGLFDPSDLRLPAALEERARTGRFRGELNMIRNDGTTFPAEISSALFTDQAGERRTTLIIRDITERKRIEQDMLLKDELLRMTGTMAKVGGWEFDAQTGSGTWTDEVARIHDLDPASETNLEIGLSFYEAESREKIERAIRQAVEEAKPYDLELEITSAAGTRKWVRTMGLPLVDGGRVVRVRGIFQDITESRRARDAIAKSEEKFRKAYYTSPDPVGINRLADGMYVSINPAFSRITGYTEQEVIGKTSWELNLWHSAEDGQKLVEDLRRDGQVTNFEAVFRMKNGDLRDGLMSATIIDLDGTPHILNITRDITEQKRAQEKLRESEKKYRWVVDNTADVIAVTDMDLHFTSISPSILRLRGYTAEEAMAQSLDQVMTPESMRIIAAAFEEEMKLEAGGTADPGRSRILELQEYRKDGSIIWVENTLSYLRDENQKPLGFISVSRDITQRMQYEERLERQLRQLAALREIDMAITGSLDMRVTLSVLLDQATATLGVDAADVLLLDPYSHKLAFAAGRGFLTDALKYSDISPGEGFAGKAALDRRTISIPDLRQEGTELFIKSPLLAEEKFISYYCVPLIAKGHVKGVLEIFNRTSLDPDPEWMDYLKALATQAAIAIENAALFDDLQKSNLEIVLSYDSTLEGWSRALDMRDRETEGHSRRVTETTVKFAQKMGIRNNELVHVRRGALLHDIGKMGIPDSILLKPGALNDDEWKIMRNHPVKAYELLFPIAYLRPALDIPYAHHEKWDGTGYPRGLKGQQIPLAARIFAIVDTWDALLSERPYRPAWPEQKAIAHIREQAGHQFDPELVRVFLAFLDEQKNHDQPPANVPAGSSFRHRLG